MSVDLRSCGGVVARSRTVLEGGIVATAGTWGGTSVPFVDCEYPIEYCANIAQLSRHVRSVTQVGIGITADRAYGMANYLSRISVLRSSFIRGAVSYIVSWVK